MNEFKNNKVLLAYWTALSNALKVLANATYGYTGSKISLLFRKPVAASVTASCRSILKKIIAYLESLDYEIIYEDTDSIFHIIPKKILEKIESKYKLRHKVSKVIENLIQLLKKLNKQ